MGARQADTFPSGIEEGMRSKPGGKFLEIHFCNFREAAVFSGQTIHKTSTHPS